MLSAGRKLLRLAAVASFCLIFVGISGGLATDETNTITDSQMTFNYLQHNQENPYPPPYEEDDSGNEDSVQEVVLKDVEMYASIFGVTTEEATNRLYLQSEIGKLNRTLIEKEADTFAGLWIEHQPGYRVIVQFTERGRSTIQKYLSDDHPLSEVLEFRTAEHNLTKIRAKRALAELVMEKLGIRSNTSVDIIDNGVNVWVNDPARVQLLLQEKRMQLPDNTHVDKMIDLGTEVTGLYGGLQLFYSDGYRYCTSGFSVVNSTSVKGVTTAGHCNDSLMYLGRYLPYMGGTSGGDYDIQWNRTVSGYDVLPVIYDGIDDDDLQLRPILAVRFRNEQALGEFVCKYGKTTGYNCGTIAQVYVNGTNIRVDIPVEPGDSGGPWFNQYTAYGTTIYQCTLGDGRLCAIYGPPDLIYDVLGVEILTTGYYLPLVIKSTGPVDFQPHSVPYPPPTL